MTSQLNHENRRILIIDDNRMIHEDFRKILAHQDQGDILDEVEAKLLGKASDTDCMPSFELQFAAQGEDGADIVKKGKESECPIAMAFVDMRMPPGWDGLETIENIWMYDDRVQIAICTAYSDNSTEEIVERFKHSDNILFIKKPFDNIEVIQTACALVNKWNLAEKVRLQMQELQHALKQKENELLTTYEKQKEIEAQFHQSQKMEAIGRLTGGVAHDFNNLLTVILGNIELITDTVSFDEKSLHRLEAITKSAQSAAKLTQQLLAFSRQQVIRPQLVCVNEIIEDNLGRLIEKIVGETFHLKKVLAPNLPRIKVDPGQLEQVIMNLVVNARDAMENIGGEIEISTKVLTDNQRRRVIIIVKDNGEGMSKETQSKIFEPFFTTKAPGKGTGIGLSTAFGIVTKHGGEISVTSEIKMGTTFTVAFPAENVS